MHFPPATARRPTSRNIGDKWQVVHQPEFYLFIAHIHHDFRSYCGRVEKIKVKKKKKHEKNANDDRLFPGINNVSPVRDECAVTRARKDEVT